MSLIGTVMRKLKKREEKNEEKIEEEWTAPLAIMEKQAENE